MNCRITSSHHHHILSRLAVGLALLPAAISACQPRVTAASTDITYPSTVETIAAVLVASRNDGATDCIGDQLDGRGLDCFWRSLLTHLRAPDTRTCKPKISGSEKAK